MLRMLYLLAGLLAVIAGGSQIQAQNTLGLLGVDETRAQPGYNLFFPHNQPDVFLVDNCGRLVHRWPDQADWRPGNAVYLLENGNLVKCKRDATPVDDPIWAGGGGAVVEIRSWENDLLHSFELNDSTYRLHHDVAPMPNGNILMIAWERFDSLASTDAGRDPAKMDQGEVWSEMVLEWDPVRDSIVWEWRVWDHLVQDFDPSHDNYGEVGAHPELIDINYDEHNGHPDWLHINAIDYNPVLDQLVLSVPYFNEIWIVDHSTTTEEAASHSGGLAGRGGDLLYRWGNPAAYRQGGAAEKRLYFQHDPNWTHPEALPGEEGFGQLAIFNNRLSPDTSAADFLLTPVDPDTRTYAMEGPRFAPDRVARRLFHPGGNIRAVSASVSSIQLLPNGNSLIMAGRWGFAYELTPDKEVVWEFITPIQQGQPARQGDTLGISDNLTFRLERYAADYPAFAGKNLNAIGYIETNPNVGFCGMLTSLNELEPSINLTAFPNPFQDFLMLETEEERIVPLRLLNLQGQVLWEGFTSGPRSRIPTAALPAGLYLLQVPGGVRRVVKQ